MSDRIGRKKTFVITLALMGIATVGIGCLPTYEVVGIAAPAALLAFRVHALFRSGLSSQRQATDRGGCHCQAATGQTRHHPGQSCEP
jgi:MFS family permease